MLIDLACLSVLSQQSTQDPLSSHPNNTGWHSSLGSTLSLTRTGMSTLSLGSVCLTNAESGMHHRGFLDDETVGVEFADVLTRVGIGDLGGLIGIKPDLAFAAAED